VVEWNGRPPSRVQKPKLVAIAAGLGDQVTPHTLRHTAATWQMQAGTDMFEAAKYLGMTTATLEQTYVHHRPDHLTAARDAHLRHRERQAKIKRTGNASAMISRTNHARTENRN
jgi:integrase